MKTFRGSWVVPLGVVLLLASAKDVHSGDNGGSEARVAQTRHFAFFSDFETNVHDALLQAGVDRKFGRPELFQEGEETACFDKLPGSMRTAWELAVAFYHQEISPEKFDSREQLWIRRELSGVAEVEREKDRTLVGITRGFLSAAAPAYEACRWAKQNAANRRWIAEAVELLEAHEDEIAARLAQLYEQPWFDPGAGATTAPEGASGLPIRSDVMETVNWAGATTILLDPRGGHIQLSIGERGSTALELVFHEASHTLMGPGAPIPSALAAAAEQVGVELPHDLWHAVLFYTTGDAVRRVFEEAGEEYMPMMFAYEGGIFGWHHAVLRAGWTGYLEGRRTLDEAARDLLRAVSEKEAAAG